LPDYLSYVFHPGPGLEGTINSEQPQANLVRIPACHSSIVFSAGFSSQVWYWFHASILNKALCTAETEPKGHEIPKCMNYRYTLQTRFRYTFKQAACSAKDLALQPFHATEEEKTFPITSPKILQI
jgi:hypothetical protein